MINLVLIQIRDYDLIFDLHLGHPLILDLNHALPWHVNFLVIVLNHIPIILSPRAFLMDFIIPGKIVPHLLNGIHEVYPFQSNNNYNLCYHLSWSINDHYIILIYDGVILTIILLFL